MTSLVIRDIKVEYKVWHEDQKETLVLLHGFTGSIETWEPIISLLPSSVKLIAVDLVGHGKTDKPESVLKYSMEEQIEILHDLFRQLKLNSIFLLGYSMGGRVALSYAHKYRDQIKHLLLESTSPGLKTKEERKNRQQSDEKLANVILEKGIKAFVDYWENIPLFATQKALSKSIQEKIRKQRLLQSELGLANSLKGLGTGVQPSLWDELPKLDIPVTFIAGSLDEKYCRIGKEMVNLLPKAKYVEVEQVGHTIHVENPTQFATIVKDALLDEM